MNANFHNSFIRVFTFNFYLLLANRFAKCVLPTSTITQRRNISEKVLEEEEAKQITWLEWLMDSIFALPSKSEKVSTVSLV